MSNILFLHVRSDSRPQTAVFPDDGAHIFSALKKLAILSSRDLSYRYVKCSMSTDISGLRRNTDLTVVYCSSLSGDTCRYLTLFSRDLAGACYLIGADRFSDRQSLETFRETLRIPSGKLIPVLSCPDFRFSCQNGSVNRFLYQNAARRSSRRNYYFLQSLLLIQAQIPDKSYHSFGGVMYHDRQYDPLSICTNRDRLFSCTDELYSCFFREVHKQNPFQSE